MTCVLLRPVSLAWYRAASAAASMSVSSRLSPFRAATPTEIVDRLNVEINAAYADRAMAARFAETGGEVLPGTPMAFGKLFGGEVAQWARLLKLSGVKSE